MPGGLCLPTSINNKDSPSNAHSQANLIDNSSLKLFSQVGVGCVCTDSKMPSNLQDKAGT